MLWFERRYTHILDVYSELQMKSFNCRVYYVWERNLFRDLSTDYAENILLNLWILAGRRTAARNNQRLHSSSFVASVRRRVSLLLQPSAPHDVPAIEEHLGMRGEISWVRITGRSPVSKIRKSPKRFGGLRLSQAAAVI